MQYAERNKLVSFNKIRSHQYHHLRPCFQQAEIVINTTIIFVTHILLQDSGILTLFILALNGKLFMIPLGIIYNSFSGDSRPDEHIAMKDIS